ncbi:uncharacterized protein LOC130367492 [Hyla sarda]|uniref:uncharacterized protein LOC130367492 n=1 Tax=Hyla sarda TaxID=327740 RepID=UPI0024C2B3FB|nr:uncharacterized protein LOC130367492 [Hyla sarda]
MMPNNLVRGSVDDTLTLPCKYPVDGGPREVCWGKGSCPISGCKNKVLAVDGTNVIWAESNRYKLLGDVTKGDVSLTISGLTKDQEGTYCCRVRIPGLFNDIKNEIKLEIKDVNLVRGSVNDKLVLPCSYDADSGTNPTCWGHGHCGLLKCHNKILQSDGNEVTWRASERYNLDGNLAKGNVSLTIESANADDGGVYCCRIAVPGAFNDIKKEIRVEIRDADRVTALVGDTVTLPCKYNVSEGTTPMCWGRGTCPTFKCTDTILETDGDVSWSELEKYKLTRNIKTGDVSLTIRSVTKEDEGMYCCRVEVPGLFNDKMKEINLEVEDDKTKLELFGRSHWTYICRHNNEAYNNEANPVSFRTLGLREEEEEERGEESEGSTEGKEAKKVKMENIGLTAVRRMKTWPLSFMGRNNVCDLPGPSNINLMDKTPGLVAPAVVVTGPLNGRVTIPCTNSDTTTTMCWGRGHCPTSKCNDDIIWTDGHKVIWRKSDRYQLLGNIRQGDVSLTITGAIKEDEGTYCCRVEIPGWFNDLKEEVTVKIEEEEIPDLHRTATEQDFTTLEECPDDTE